MLLRTKRLILRSPVEEDIDAYADICNSEFVLRFNAMMIKSTDEIALQFQKESAQNSMLLIELAESATVIGAIFIEEDSVRWGVCARELSYFLGEQYSKKGYMKEALSEVIRYLHEDLAITCVAARSFAPNLASRKLLESLGFHLDGIIPHCVKGYGNIIFDDTLYSHFSTNN